MKNTQKINEVKVNFSSGQSIIVFSEIPGEGPNINEDRWWKFLKKKKYFFIKAPEKEIWINPKIIETIEISYYK